MANTTSAEGDLETATCYHKNIITRVLDSCATCETTALYCVDCGAQRTSPQTDCV